MSATPEGYVKDDLKAWFKEIGAYYIMPVKERHGRVGIPDFLVCLGGLFFGIECKRPGNEGGSTPRQKDEAIAIREAGGIALVISDVEQLKDYCYANQSIRAQLPARSSERVAQKARRAAHAAARKVCL